MDFSKIVRRVPTLIKMGYGVLHFLGPHHNFVVFSFPIGR